MRNFIGLLWVGCLLLISVPHATADIVASYSAGSTANGGYVNGQSFTSTAPTSETNIVFTFYQGAGNTVAAPAVGTGYLLSQAYTGTPANLSSSTPGYLGSAVGSGTTYSFGSSVTLAPNTQYWFYENATIAEEAYGTTYSGGLLYFSQSGSAFATIGSQSLDFSVAGTAAVPEPSSMILLGLAIGVPVVTRLRRRRRVIEPTS